MRWVKWVGWGLGGDYRFARGVCLFCSIISFVLKITACKINISSALLILRKNRMREAGNGDGERRLLGVHDILYLYHHFLHRSTFCIERGGGKARGEKTNTNEVSRD
ncbi:hypothetical protein DFP73DRAFT_21084 [Morchella snyderi]|nr:hypothetical protein DFP73DRAFT_21084 [Morchella snyderi]